MPARFQEPPALALVVAGHGLQLLPGGAERLAALLELVEQAQQTVDLAFYIYEPDAVGARVRDALVRAAARGVKVRLVVDGFGANVDAAFFASLTSAGGDFRIFSQGWTRHYLIRNHQKFLIADGKQAMLGGFNIADDYFAGTREEGWSDLGLVIEGPVVTDLVRWFERLYGWVSCSKAPWHSIRIAVRDWTPGNGAMQVLIGGPTLGLSSWAASLLHDLGGGRRLDMIIAYFSPAAGFLRRIAHIARRGSARLVLAGKSDNGATIGAARSLYKYLLKRGTKISEFSLTKLHTKLIVIDDVTYLGSANFDMRSLYLNLEIMLRIDDAALAAQLRAYIDRHAAAAVPITLDWHRANAGVVNRVRWVLSWFLVAVVDYTVTRRLNLGQ
ncbi:MAG: cardiolipin synthase B [Erythrobacter sp.]|nr:cardiolipin synthase B [Erythrobacter sp.]